jgi:DNA-binding MarR family transcriptional regulator
MTEISNKMGHSTAAATGLVDRLEKLGYVQRLHAADDRRKVMVQITRKGMDLVNRMRDHVALNIAETMSKMDSNPSVDATISFDQLSDLLMQGR